jgi:hypothetical protein
MIVNGFRGTPLCRNGEDARGTFNACDWRWPINGIVRARELAWITVAHEGAL